MELVSAGLPESCGCWCGQLGLVGHDAVVGAARPGTAGAGAVATQHLRGGPAVQLLQVALRAAPVQPGLAEMVPEPTRVDRHAGLAAAAGGGWVHAAGVQRAA